jgi:hypothetical protein
MCAALEGLGILEAEWKKDQTDLANQQSKKKIIDSLFMMTKAALCITYPIISS